MNTFKEKSMLILLFADTGRQIYETGAEDIYENFYKDRCFFDFSDYSRESNLFCPVNKKVIGKIIDKFLRRIISEFVGLKSKVYSLVDADGEEN